MGQTECQSFHMVSDYIEVKECRVLNYVTSEWNK